MHLPIYLPTHPPTHPSIHPSIRVCVCVCVCVICDTAIQNRMTKMKQIKKIVCIYEYHTTLQIGIFVKSTEVGFSFLLLNDKRI
jgi:hypothetical protein